MFCEKGGVADGMHFTISPAVKIPNEAAQRDAYSAMEPNEMEPESQPLLDNSLTSLGWLQNLKVFDMFSPEVRVGLLPPSPCSEDDFSWETVSSSSTSPDEKKGQLNDETFPLSPIHKCIMQSARFRNAPKRYRNNPAKPPFSFTSLIYLAIQHSRSGKATLHDICRWIKTNFKYFRATESPWQNSIRHSLTLSELFTKVPRSHGDSSKGSYWTIDPRWKHILSVESNGQPEELAKGGRKRAYSFSGDRRPSGGMRKRVKSDNHLPADPCGLPGDLDWVSLLSSQRVNCGSCPSQACRPVYGSPILGPPDLGQVGDPMVCSPLILPTTLSSDLSPQTPVLRDSGKGKELEEVVWKQDSPSPHLLPWADSQPQSPCLHPWAESKETTLRNLHRQSRQALTLASQNHTWSPETSYSSSCSTVSIASLSYKQKKIAGESYIY